MNFQPHLVALDIDGTLVDEMGELADGVYDAVQTVLQAGVPVVLSTGRGWLSTEMIYEQLDLPPGWAVTANGATVVTNPPLELRYQELFDPAETLQHVARMAPNALLGVQDGLTWRVTRPFPEGELHGEVTVSTLEEMSQRPVSRIVVRDPDASEEEFFDLTAQLGLHEVSYFIGWSAWLDIAPRGVDKAHGLEKVLPHLGVRRENVLALGDGRNDIEMLQWAGRGVAMGNAPDEVKAAAHHVTGTYDAGGVADEIARWF